MKNLISIKDLSIEEIEKIFSLTNEIKKKPHKFSRYLRGKSFALIFHKPSLRTRVSFETGIFQLGAKAVYLEEEIGFSKREPVKDIARVLSRYVDGVIIRTFSHQLLLDFAKYSTAAVINALTDSFHPCQVLSDLWTIREKRGELRKVKIAYVGDGNNVCNSLIYGNDPEEVVKDADIIYTDVWTSMGEEEREDRKEIFQNFQVSKRLVNYAKPDCLIMHCLPAHRGEEITDEVIEGRNSIVFEQAENRLYVQKAILISLDIL